MQETATQKDQVLSLIDEQIRQCTEELREARATGNTGQVDHTRIERRTLSILKLKIDQHVK